MSRNLILACATALTVALGAIPETRAAPLALSDTSGQVTISATDCTLFGGGGCDGLGLTLTHVGTNFILASSNPTLSSGTDDITINFDVTSALPIYGLSLSVNGDPSGANTGITIQDSFGNGVGSPGFVNADGGTSDFQTIPQLTKLLLTADIAGPDQTASVTIGVDVPEPASAGVLAVGLVAAGARRRKR